MAVNRQERHTKIPVVEETLHVDKKVVDVGRVRILKEIATENVTTPLVARLQGYSIERVPMRAYVDEPPPTVRYEGKTMIISVVEEEAVVVKKLRLVEEIRITPFQRETEKDIEVTLKKERITVEKDPSELNDKR